MTVQLTILAENTAGARGLLGEHGFAVWLENDDGCLLFDTGQGLVLEHNAAHLGIPLETARAVVLSHGHYDHGGGLESVLPRLQSAKLYAHPEAFQRRYSLKPSGASDVGIPPLVEAKVHAALGPMVPTRAPTEIAAGIWVTGEIARRSSLEDTGGPFYLDPEGTRPDPLVDDQALVVDSTRGAIVLLGCGHSGVVNTLHHVQEVMQRERVHAVIGGMHLRAASDERIAHTARALDEAGVEVVAPAHCTGWRATAALITALGSRVTRARVGSHLGFDG